MAQLRPVAFFMLVALLNNCSNGQGTRTNLSALEFEAKIKQFPTAPILDVRTPGEFSKGHLRNAVNVDWNVSNFVSQIAKLDKSKPVFVYCLSGVRSSEASSQMRSNGFREVYELNGGLLKWRSADLPETSSTKVRSMGMTLQDFNNLIVGDKVVLIDFYADWCAPCKKMEPYLQEISKEMTNEVLVIRINTDDNPGLCKELKIDALPFLQVYKSKTLAWTNTGYIEKADVIKQLQKVY